MVRFAVYCQIKNNMGLKASVRGIPRAKIVAKFFMFSLGAPTEILLR